MLFWLYRATAALVFLFTIVFSVPLIFDVGGRTCGLAFSLSLVVYYSIHSILSLAIPSRTRLGSAAIKLLSASQWLVIPTLMIWTLNKFSLDANSTTWMERTFNFKRAVDTSLTQWLFGRGGLMENMAIGGWDRLLRWSVPFFQLVEGFCSLLVIQAAGQITRHTVNKEGGDNWMIALLVLSASIISSSVYFLYRITTFPELNSIDAVLIGAAIMCAIFLCAWGIGSGRGNPVESSLLFAYVTLCIYQIFTDYQPALLSDAMPPPSHSTFPPLPPIIMASYSTLMHLLSTLPSTLRSAFNFFIAATMTITPSVIISLAYRVFVMYASTRIIPAVRESGARGLSQEPSLEDSDGVGQVLGLMSWFSPSLIISVYTSLLLQHFSNTGGPGGSEGWWTSQGGNANGSVWRWANLAITMSLYALELYLGKDHDDRVTTRWKID